jgi:hypothetical protein
LYADCAILASSAWSPDSARSMSVASLSSMTKV